MKTVFRKKFTIAFLVVSLCLVVLGLNSMTAGGADNRSYVSGNYMLELDGVKCGFVKSVSGGAISAEVINEPSGPDYFVKKHIGQPKYEDITLQIGMNMNKSVYEWIASIMTMNYQRKNGAIIYCDYNLNATKRLEFNNALITEVTFPACDGANKEPAYITLKIAPEYIRNTAASGKLTGGYGKIDQKVWLPSNFRFNIDNLGTANNKVNKVEAITIKQTVVTDDIGDARDYLKEPGKLEFPNIVITVAEVTAQPLVDWHKSFVIEGNNDELQERSGYLELLSPNRQQVFIRLDFKNVGIFRQVPDKIEANADAIKRLKAEFYCERMMMQYKGDKLTPGTTPTPTPSSTPKPPLLRIITKS
jgi:phage tail-like protein